MAPTEKQNQFLHSKLPIDQDENILAVFRHHWFAYASSWIVAAVLVVLVLGMAGFVTTLGGSDSSVAQYRTAIIAGAGLLCVIIVLGAYLPVYLRTQEQLVLTDEALLQVLQPSLFASKVDQLGLSRVDDISVRQDFLGTILGYGHITIETPGEQDNYEFLMLPKPHDAARTIAQAKENFEAALNSGRLKTTLGEAPTPAAAPAIDPQQYQEFLQYQQMVAQQKQEQEQSVPPQPQMPQQPITEQQNPEEPQRQ